MNYIWLIIYLLLAVGGAYTVMHTNFKVSLKNSLSIFIVLIAGSFIVKLFLSANSVGFANDVACFENWSGMAGSNLSTFYTSTWCDYPPFYIIMLGIFNILFVKTNIFTLALGFRLPALICEIVFAGLAFKLALKYFNSTAALLVGALILFNPLVILDTSLWGQMDIVLTTFIALFIYFLDSKRIVVATIFMACAILIKPQALFFLPILIFYIIKEKKWKNLFISAGVGLLTVVLIILPFNKSTFTIATSKVLKTISPNILSLIQPISQIPIIKDLLWLIDLFMGTASTYTNVSLNAANIYAMFRMNSNPSYLDNFSFWGTTYATVGIIMIVVIVILALISYFKNNEISINWYTAAFLNAGIFMFVTRMHERYMFSVFAFLFIAWLFSKDWWTIILALGFSTTNYLNAEDCLTRMITLQYPHIPSDSLRMILTSFFNLVLLLILGILIYKHSFKKILSSKIEINTKNTP